MLLKAPQNLTFCSVSLIYFYYYILLFFDLLFIVIVMYFPDVLCIQDTKFPFNMFSRKRDNHAYALIELKKTYIYTHIKLKNELEAGSR